MKYTQDLKDYKTKIERIKGFKKLQKAGLRIPNPIKLVAHQAFAEYKKKGMTKELAAQIKLAFSEIKKENPRRLVIVRRAYYVPDLESPPGPHSAFLNKPTPAVRAVGEMFDFAIQNNFDKKGSQIAAWLQPVIDDIEYSLVGGCATPSKEKKDIVIIEAIYGEDEGVQSLPHDTYLVDFKKGIIVNKEIQHKTFYIKYSARTKGGLERTTRKTPKDLQGTQVLNDILILQVALDFEKLVGRFGPHRIEFTCPKKEGLFYLECAPFKVKRPLKKVIKIQGEVLRVRELGDIEDIKKDIKIVFIDPSVIKERKRDLLTVLAVNAPHQMVILYPGTATTAHAATIFRERGHKMVFVPGKSFKTGELVAIDSERGVLVVKRLGKGRGWILPLDELASIDIAKTGNKAWRLAELKRKGFNTPKAFVITIDTFDYFIKKARVNSLIEELVLGRSQSFLKETSLKIQEKILKTGIPKALVKEIKTAFKNLGVKKVAVRSSATCEDMPGASFAGQFESYLGVKGKDLLGSIKKCWASVYTLGAVNYIIYSSIPLDAVKMAVLVQEMVFAEKGGVIFTKDVVKNDLNRLVIEAAKGLGERVVSGLVNPERVVLSKRTKKVIEKQSPNGEVLTNKEIRELSAVALKIEKLYHCPQDIEWAIMKNKIYILQSRPITT